MPKEFETKRVLVTGAASGIGQAQAIAFAEQGAEVIGIDLDETGLKQTAALVNPDSTKPAIDAILTITPFFCWRK